LTCIIASFALMLAGALALSGCGDAAPEPAPEPEPLPMIDPDPTTPDSIDYLALVNKQNPLPSGWEESIQTVTVKNSLGDDVEVEAKAYAAYLELKADLEKDGIHVDLDSARRSVSEQQRIWDEFTVTYGEVYTRTYVAVPGYSEHHTGLALDLYLNIDGEDVYLNEDMVEYPEIWAQIHSKLADHGFILRYLEGKEDITSYGYEPWHIRYVDSPKIAHEIMDQGITLEEYLGAASQMPAAA
ncbi:MAG: M15 family metallopeptidase, partial [Coriobacteriales bacterium]|nr:M15 family metallopeptidase [Coriobacteriales bacterium]